MAEDEERLLSRCRDALCALKSVIPGLLGACQHARKMQQMALRAAGGERAEAGEEERQDAQQRLQRAVEDRDALR